MEKRDSVSLSETGSSILLISARFYPIRSMLGAYERGARASWGFDQLSLCGIITLDSGSYQFI